MFGENISPKTYRSIVDDALHHPMPLVITSSAALCTQFTEVIVVIITNVAMIMDIKNYLAASIAF